MKQLFTAVAILLLVAAPALGQTAWQFEKVFPDTFYTGLSGSSGVHGLAVSPDGKVWIQIYGLKDSVFDAVAGKFRNCRTVDSFNPDGTPSSIGPVKIVQVPGDPEPDTLYNSNRGMKSDHEGNIVFASFDTYYKIDYKTGAGLGKVRWIPDVTLTAPAITAAGEIFAAAVIPPQPIKIYASDFSELGNAVDTARGFSRDFEVSKDGNDIYWAGFTNDYVVRIHSDNGTLGPYAAAETILVGMSAESFCWNPKTGHLWLSAGSSNDIPVGWSQDTWYAYDTATKQVVDSLKWNYTPPGIVYPTGSTAPRPRAMAFSPGGDTAYVGCFNYDKYPVQMFVRKPTSVTPINDMVPANYTLSQNYPNPFNPSTEIEFSVPTSGMTTLVVYDMLGKEVLTLVNENLAPGTYKTRVDASKLASGTYIYTLTSGSARMSKKMMLLK